MNYPFLAFHNQKVVMIKLNSSNERTHFGVNVGESASKRKKYKSMRVFCIAKPK